MESFSGGVREALCRKTFEELGFNRKERVKMRECCADAFFSALLLFLAKEKDGGLEFRAVREDLTELAEFLLIRSYGVEAPFVLREEGLRRSRIFLSSPRLLPDRLFEKPTFLCDRCREYFYRAAFLSCGTVLDPEKGYHAAFVCKKPASASLLQSLLAADGLRFAAMAHPAGTMLYTKDSGTIEDLLALLGAPQISMELMAQKIEKEIRNTVNRRQNFDGANLGRQIRTAQDVIASIRVLEACGALADLPEALREAARVRTENPEASLRELCGLLGGISKSGLNHRFTKLNELAQERKKNERTE